VEYLQEQDALGCSAFAVEYPQEKEGFGCSTFSVNYLQEQTENDEQPNPSGSC
jgi:hypothetical protein